MVRRRQNDKNWLFALAQLSVLLVFLACICLPFQLGFIAFCNLAIIGTTGGGLLLIIGWMIWEACRPRKRPSSWKPAVIDIAPCPPPATLDKRKPRLEGKEQLIERLRAIDWFQFEKVIAVIFRKRGYIVTRRGGANADGGIDIVLELDGQKTAVQCKQWKTWNVGVKNVREFLGALTDSGIKQGIFVTLRGYTDDAKQLAEKHGIQILNETGLAQMMEANGARFDPELISAMNDTRKFCPKCEREMVLRTAKKGAGAGDQFWGCSTYPDCRYTMQKS
jgi:restriction system protein